MVSRNGVRVEAVKSQNDIKGGKTLISQLMTWVILHVLIGLHGHHYVVQSAYLSL